VEDGPHTGFVMITPQTALWAADEVCRALRPDQIAALKVPSGEHLAAILATTFLFCPPASVHSAGGPDLVFDYSRRQLDREPPVSLGPLRYADFEVKSLPGAFREYDAMIDRALAAGRWPEHEYAVTIQSAADVLRGPGRSMIDKARGQLARKSSPDHSKNVFLIAHVLEYPYVEMFDHLISPKLPPLDDLQDIESVWLYFAPMHLAVWSSRAQIWTELILDADRDGDRGFVRNQDFLQELEDRFLTCIGHTSGSPYLFGLTAGDAEEQ
jgi:hypothetical protein